MTRATNSKLIESVSQLLAYESTSKRPDDLRAALHFVETRLNQVQGITVEHFESEGSQSLLAYFGDSRPTEFDVLLNAHVDVVPGTVNQFKPTVRDNRLYGRGAADMKAAAFVMADVFCDLAPKVPYALGFQVVTDEEVGGHNGTRYQVEHGVNAKFVLAGEDTPRNSICVAMCGTCWVEFEVKGKSAHSGYVWKGENAVIKATKLIERLLSEFPIPTQDSWVTTANIAYIETDEKLFNRVPDTSRFGVDFRYVPSDGRFSTRESVVAFLSSLDRSAKFTIKQYEPSHSTDPQNDSVQKLVSAVAQVTGSKPSLVNRHGAADVRFYSAAGTPAVTMGLPDNGTHSASEYVELSAVSEYQEVIHKFLSEFSHCSLQKS